MIAEALFDCDADEAHFEFPDMEPRLSDDEIDEETVQVSWIEWDYDGCREHEYRSFSVQLLWDDEWRERVIQEREDQRKAARIAAHQEEIKRLEQQLKQAEAQAASAQKYANDRAKQLEDQLLKLMEKGVV